MKKLLWMVFAVLELILLAHAEWGMAGFAALIPVAIGLVLAVNDWCLAPLRNAISTNGSGRSPH